MESLLKYAAVMGLGAFAYSQYLKMEAEKTQSNPDEEIEDELRRRINELDYRERMIAGMQRS